MSTPTTPRPWHMCASLPSTGARDFTKMWWWTSCATAATATTSRTIRG
eukprot:jgi/Mesen1/135/ME1128779C07610